ncbi:tetratricopeptide repeat protein 38-like isoform X1 [Mercenaria mercenaria]|uniref:tetratricopeptide repeat protein 38-like isoform X1 n=1 Tax=Mercenaria mercenaria TaxID=6596 RepID=UPI00234E8C58|nr:tetratricopeptide repeat protein 38-like isoform X1 [Mercenaria mercenaria]
MHSHWRDCQAWQQFGTPWSTTSNEACKQFDASLTQYVGWYDDTSVGGIEKSLDKTLEADPNFVMGHVIKNGLELLGTGTNVRLNKDLANGIDTMVKLAGSQAGLSDREKKHVNAVKLWSDGEMSDACNVWEDILMENPYDMLALKFAHDTYFYLGYSTPMRDSLGRVFPQWKDSMPLYGYLYGMYSFGLEETNLYAEAEKIAGKGLEINPRDAWSTHSMAHVLEMMGRQDEGIKFMSGTENNWSTCGMLSCHNYWHWALHLIEKEDYQGALGIYDNHCFNSAKASGAPLDFVDACSLLMRLEMDGANVEGRWKDIYEVIKSHEDDHVLTFNDNHILLACLGAENKAAVEHLMTSIKDWLKQCKGDQVNITNEVGLPICEAFVAYKEDDPARAVDILYPLRYKIIKIGGSHAQRDLYNLFLIHAALRSNNPKHHKLARFLLQERKSVKSCSPMTDRLIQRAMAQHVD